jgi:decaprenylphospho-beta-D-ribofuranose 2-oxidase
VSDTPARLRVSPDAERLDCYSELRREYARVGDPRCADDVTELFEWAAKTRRRVTFRAGGQSFDGQSLGDDLVVSMKNFDGVEVRADTNQVRVDAGATWGAILAELERHDLMPAVTVTTENATAGGTLSGDCLSRYSVAYGKEGTHVRSFKLMTPEGKLIDCTRPEGAPATLGERLYLGAIGGLGYLGAVLSITYDVLPVPPGPGPVTVETTVERHNDLVAYANAFVDKVQAVANEDSCPLNTDLHDAVYSGLAMRGGDSCWALIFKSKIARGARGRPMLLYKPHSRVRVPVEWLFRWPPFNTLVWWAAYAIFYRRASRFVNGLADYTFFMDGNARAKRIARRFGIRLKNLQETFIIPTHFDADDGVRRARQDLVDWLRLAQRVFEEHGIAPTFQDVLWLPRDLSFPLSATAESAGFAASYSFETNDGRRLQTAEDALAQLAHELTTRWGGSVYLVKNVCAARKDLEAMYGARAETFFALKREVDPQTLVRNPFLERTLWPEEDPAPPRRRPLQGRAGRYAGLRWRRARRPVPD